MDFKQQIAKHVTGNLTTNELPGIAIQGLEEGFDSDSLVILAAMGKNDNVFELEDYFSKTLTELQIKLPTKRQAALEYACGIIDDILNGKKDLIGGVYEIKNNAIDSYDFFSESNEYCYDSIGFEKIYGLFDEYFEIKECGQEWNKRKNLESQIDELKNELLIELQNWKEKLKNGV